MTTSRADTQTKLDAAVTSLRKATTAPATMVAKHGVDPVAWPNGPLKTGFLGLDSVRTEIGDLADPAPPKAAFTFKEVA